MEQKLLKRAAHSSVLLMLLVIVMSVAATGYREHPGYAMAMGTDAKEGEAAVSVPEKKGVPIETIEPRDGVREEDITDYLGERYLIIPKNGAETGGVTLTEQYVYRTLELTVEHVERLSWAEDSVMRISGEKQFSGKPDASGLELYMDEYLYRDEEPVISGNEDEIGLDMSGGLQEENQEENQEDTANTGTEDPVQEVQVAYDSKTGAATMSITLNHLYVPILYEDTDFYYIDLKYPKEVYDKILVIDAGHGGKHPGTMSSDHVYLEKNVNLSIVRELKKLLDKREDIKVYYTRLDDSSVYLRPRVNLANEAEADFFISIHNNAYENQYAYGTEVLYNELLDTKGSVGSRELAGYCLDEVTKLLGTRKRGVQMSSSTYIIGHSEVPVALVEVGYLTNPDDLKMLLKEENIKLAAQGVYNAILRAYEKKGKDDNGV